MFSKTTENCQKTRTRPSQTAPILRFCATKLLPNNKRKKENYHEKNLGIDAGCRADIELDVSLYNATVNSGSDSDTSGSTDAEKDNPDTGAVDYVNIAVALGVVSLAAAGAVALKR